MPTELALLVSPQAEQAQLQRWLEDDGFEVDWLPSVAGLADRVRRTHPALVVARLANRRERLVALRAAVQRGRPALVFVGAVLEEGDLGIWPCTPASTAAELSHAVTCAFAAREAQAGNWNAPLEQGLARLASVAASSSSPSRAIDALVDACGRALGARACVIALKSAPTGALRLPPLSERPAPCAAVLELLSRAVARGLPTWELDEDERGKAERFAIPVVVREEVLGAIAFEREGRAPLGRGALRIVCAAKDLVCVELERHRLADVLEHRDRLAAMGELLAGVAHEINTPVAYVRANLSALQTLQRTGRLAGPAGIDVGSLVQDCAAGAEQIASLVASLRAGARQPRGPGAVLELRQIAEHAATLVKAQLHGRPAIRLDEDDAVPVRGDYGRLLQVALNLLNNAVQAAGPGGCILVRTGAGEGTSFLEVEDDGPGVSKEVADRVFEPFFTTKATDQGTGLGLTISRRIAEEHGGELSLRARPGPGAAFRLSLPVISVPARRAEPLRVMDAPRLGARHALPRRHPIPALV